MGQGEEVQFRTQITSRLGERIPVVFFGVLREDIFFIMLKDLRGQIRIEEEFERVKKELTRKDPRKEIYTPGSFRSS